jgi:hypothetical protein
MSKIFVVSTEIQGKAMDLGPYRGFSELGNISRWFVVNLVGGDLTILKKNEFVSWDDDIPIYEMENKTCLKPPTRYGLSSMSQSTN